MSHRVTIRIVVMLLCLAPPVALSAQGRVSGVVKDVRTGLGLEGAIVAVIGLGISAESGHDGSFEIGPIPDGSHRVRARAGGYREVEIQVLVEGGAPGRPLEFALAPAVLRLDETVSVTASREARDTFETPRSVSVVQTADLERTAPRTSAEALSRTPGVFVQKTNHGGGSPFIRGLVGNQILVLVDGLRLNNSTFRYGPNQYLATVDPGQADRIEVLRGSGSAQYGSDGLGGVIHVRNREPVLSPAGTLMGGRVGGRLMTQGQEQTARVDLGISSSGAALAGAVAVRNFGDIVAGAGLGRESPSGYTEIDGDVRAVVDAGRMGRLTLAYQHVHQDDVPRFDQVQRGYERYSFAPQVRQMAFARLALPSDTGGFDAVTITGAWMRSLEGRERRRAGSTLQIVEEDTVTTWAATVEARRVLRYGWTLVAGTEIYHDTVRSWRRDDDSGTGESVPRRGLFPDGATALFAAGFGLGHYQRGAFSADLGGRYTWTHIRAEDAVFGDTDVSPGAWVGSAAAAFDLGRQAQLFGSAAQGFRAPNLDDLSTLGPFDFGVEIPAGQLAPERSLAVEAGIRFRGAAGAASIAAFRTSLTNLIDRVRIDAVPPGLPPLGDDRVYQRANVGEAFVRGVEAEGEWIARRGTTIRGYVAYAYGQNESRNEPMRRIPPVNGLIGLRQDAWSGWWIEGSLQAASTQDRLAAGDIDDHRIPPGGTPGWWVVDVFAGKTFSRRLSVSAGILNLFNEAYRTHGSGIDGYGRSAWIGADTRF